MPDPLSYSKNIGVASITPIVGAGREMQRDSVADDVVGQLILPPPLRRSASALNGSTPTNLRPHAQASIVTSATSDSVISSRPCSVPHSSHTRRKSASSSVGVIPAASNASKTLMARGRATERVHLYSENAVGPAALRPERKRTNAPSRNRGTSTGPTQPPSYGREQAFVRQDFYSDTRLPSTDANMCSSMVSASSFRASSWPSPPAGARLWRARGAGAGARREQLVGEVSRAAEAFGVSPGCGWGRRSRAAPRWRSSRPTRSAWPTPGSGRCAAGGIGAAVESERPGRGVLRRRAACGACTAARSTGRVDGGPRARCARPARIGAGPSRFCALAAADARAPRRPEIVARGARPARASRSRCCAAARRPRALPRAARAAGHRDARRARGAAARGARRSLRPARPARPRARPGARHAAAPARAAASGWRRRSSCRRPRSGAQLERALETARRPPARPPRAPRADAARAVARPRGWSRAARGASASSSARRWPTRRGCGSRSAGAAAQLPAPAETLRLAVERFGPPHAGRPRAVRGRRAPRAARGCARRSARRAPPRARTRRCACSRSTRTRACPSAARCWRRSRMSRPRPASRRGAPASRARARGRRRAPCRRRPRGRGGARVVAGRGPLVDRRGRCAGATGRSSPTGGRDLVVFRDLVAGAGSPTADRGSRVALPRGPCRVRAGSV